MPTLRSKLIRLAHENPELRADLLPLLEKTARLQKGDRVRMKPDHWTGVGSDKGVVTHPGRDRVLVKFDDGTTVDVDARALKKTAAGAFGGFYAPLKNLPDWLVKVLHTEARYKKKDIQIVPTSKVDVGIPAFEGNRSFAIAVNLATGRYETARGSYSGMDNTPVDRGGVIQVPSNGAIISGEYGGRGAFARIYINPDNVSALIEEQGSEDLSEEEKYAISYIKTLNSRGRKDAFARRGLGPYGATNPHVQALAQKGLVKISGRAVKITTKGKNVVQGLDRKYERTW